MHSTATQTNHLFALFAHERAPAEFVRTLAVAKLREWPDLWKTDPRRAPLIDDSETETLVRGAPGCVRYFAATDPEYPNVPLLRTDAGAVSRAGEAHDAGIRDKFWQRLVVEEAGALPQPDFAIVNGNRIEASNAQRLVRVVAVDCRSARAALRSAFPPGTVVVVEACDVGFVAVARTDGVHLKTRSPHVAARSGGSGSGILSAPQWARFVDALCGESLPLEITKAAFNPTADLGEALLSAPGSYVLKPRFGSNGFCVARITSTAGQLSVESDCPDTAAYLDEFPRDPDLRGRDLVTAVAAHRARFINRALAGLPERSLNQSILEEEIPQHRAEGSIFEPRIVVQRTCSGASESFITLGAICKRIDSAVGASVVRDFREEPLDVSLRRFLRERVPPRDLARSVEETRAELLTAGDRLRGAVVPLLETRGARILQFGIDCRLCWNPVSGRAEFPFLEFQFGIGRIDPSALGPALAGYKTRAELITRFGPETG
jgi:hypothetical protein